MSLSASMEALCNANAAALGGVVATTFTYPVDTVGKKVITTGGSAAEVLQTILKEQGLAGLFRGLGAKLGWSFWGKFVFYGSYSLLNTAWVDYIGTPVTFGPDLLLGYLSEVSTIPVALPFEAISTRMQTAKGAGLFKVVSQVFAEKGIAGFFKGLAAYPMLCITPAITNSVFAQLKNFVLERNQATSLGTAEAFVLGAIARTIATCIMYPFLRAKTTMQAGNKKTDGNSPPETSPFQIILRVVKTEGFGALYRGLNAELLRGVLSSAITLMLKERIYGVNRAAFMAMAAGPTGPTAVAIDSK